jgi:hypothetical protein
MIILCLLFSSEYIILFNLRSIQVQVHSHMLYCQQVIASLRIHEMMTRARLRNLDTALYSCTVSIVKLLVPEHDTSIFG